MSQPVPGSHDWRRGLDPAAAALVLAVLDGDEPGVNAILGTCTQAEAAGIALTFARILAGAADQPGFRESLTALLQSGTLQPPGDSGAPRQP